MIVRTGGSGGGGVVRECGMDCLGKSGGVSIKMKSGQLPVCLRVYQLVRGFGLTHVFSYSRTGVLGPLGGGGFSWEPRKARREEGKDAFFWAELQYRLFSSLLCLSLPWT